MPTKLTLAEMETHLWFDLEERVWWASTEIPSHARRLEKMGWRFSEETREWEAPDGAVLIRRASRPARTSPTRATEQGRAALERINAARKAAKAEAALS